MIQRIWAQLGQEAKLLRGRVYQSLWIEMGLAAMAASALMAVVSGVVVLHQGSRQLRHASAEVQRQLSGSLTSYAPLYNLQRGLQEATTTRLSLCSLIFSLIFSWVS